jgi:hypothetical protein
MPSSISSKEPFVVGRCGYSPYSFILKDYTVVFDHLAIANRKLLDIGIVFKTTREKLFIVTGDRD